jgi:monovalent cation:H+ antiporter-2, CPA2 family
MRRVIRTVQDQRDARYNLLRGYFHGQDDDTVDELDHERLQTVTIALASKTIGQALDSLALHAVGVRVMSLRRKDGQTAALDGSVILQEGDTLVLNGKPVALALAEAKLLRA